jgi:hypothetical protein
MQKKSKETKPSKRPKDRGCRSRKNKCNDFSYYRLIHVLTAVELLLHVIEGFFVVHGTNPTVKNWKRIFYYRLIQVLKHHTSNQVFFPRASTTTHGITVCCNVS